jgi:predicted nucleic acid-binding protein
VKGIADTGLLVAFANRDDEHHDWAVSVAEQADSPLLTCEAVLAETAFHLRNARVVLDMVSEGMVVVALDVTRELPHLAALATRYADRRPDLADLCLIRLSELNPRHRVITVDAADFQVYRRNKRDVIPVLCPPS